MSTIHLIVALPPTAGAVTAAIVGGDILTGASVGVAVLGLCFLAAAMMMKLAIDREASPRRLAWLDRAASAAYPVSAIAAPLVTVVAVYFLL